MIWILNIGNLLIIIASISNAIMDILKDNFNNSIFSKLNEGFWNPYFSWRNKYKNLDKSQGRIYPNYLSGLTDTFSDAWHIAKFIMIVCVIIGFSLDNSFSWESLIIKWVLWGIIFKLFYSKILINK
jgi:hypothetical protein